MKRGDIWLVLFDPTKGSEQDDMRPALIVSPDSMNTSLDIKVVIPLTTKIKDWPSRVNTEFKGQKGQAMCEQIRTISSRRLKKYLGEISTDELIEILSTIGALYAKH